MDGVMTKQDVTGKEALSGDARDELMKRANELAERCHYEKGHTRQVTKLALDLFDQLEPLHQLGDKERLLLECGAILHDIGWTTGQARHHKAARDIILADRTLPLTPETRLEVALLARYHRKACPSLSHKRFARLDPGKQKEVAMLAAILRVADALDRTHTDAVKSLSLRIEPKQATLACESDAPLDDELAACLKKSDLFQQVFDRELACRRA
jgi:exopolyphosphatase/guanosine-5'-triphosphate,3'-diphosphate pyrophosphatase